MKTICTFVLATTVAAATAGVAAGETSYGKPVEVGAPGAKARVAPAPVDGGGGGGAAGCWYFPASHGENHWYGSWRHVFQPVWCGNGYAITYVDPAYHYQSAGGLYGAQGTSRFRTGGCVGCGSISYHALANFSFNLSGWTSHMTRDIWITLWPSGGLVNWGHD